MNIHFMDTCNFSTFMHILFLVLLIQSQQGSSSLELYYQTCGNKFTCGESINGIKYPFRGSYDPPYCGYPSLVLTCTDQDRTTIEIMSMNYTVLEINPSAQTMVIAREDLVEGQSCPQDMVNTTIDHTLFDYNTLEYTNITFLYGCPDTNLPGSSNYYYVPCGNRYVHVLPGDHGPGDCDKSIVVPVNVDVVSGEHVNTTRLDRVLRLGFEIRYNVDDEKKCGDCVESKGRCGIDPQTNQTTCFCAYPPYVSDTCRVVSLSSPPVDSPGPEKKLSQARENRSRRGRDIALYIAGAVLASVILGLLIFFCKPRKKQRVVAQTSNKEIRAIPSSKKALISPRSTSFSSIIPSLSSTSSQSNLGRSCSYYGVPIFDYAELERATNNFDSSRELGDGGFGTVYYGLLLDGREVAIKLLYEHNFRRVEQFMNEIKILTKLFHENLVKLYGCTSRRSRELILVYEYVPNGTVADHLHGKLAKTSCLLPWPTRLNIAIETAKALAYLHISDIVHRDVKTNNILLDKDFHVKVADFGLSRLFPCNATHVSTAPQGTPGYVDPEYYQCYKVTEKSDVYSFGVVLIELISSLQAVDLERSRTDINLSNMAMCKIQSGTMHELFDSRLGFETSGDVRMMMTLVSELAFRCLQQEGDMRPSMQEVLESLMKIKDGEVCKVEIVDIMLMDEDCDDGNDAVALSSSSSDSTPLNPAY